MYLGDDVERTWREGAPTGNVGRPDVYPDAVILLGLVLQQVYRLPLRQTVGLLRSVLSLAGLVALPVPDTSTLCRRRSAVTLPAWPKAGGCMVIDSTGLQIRGPGTWLTTVHGLQRRTYRKIHLGVDPVTSLVVAGVVTPCQTYDREALAEVITVAAPAAGAVLIGDGAYDRQRCYAAARRHRYRLLTSPSKRAVLHADPAWAARNTAIEEVRFLGKPEWQRSVHYGRRSLPESAMHRLKATFSSRLRSRIAPISITRRCSALISSTAGPRRRLASLRFDLGCLTCGNANYATGPTTLSKHGSNQRAGVTAMRV